MTAAGTRPQLTDKKLADPLSLVTGVDLSGEQQTNTRRALEFFGARITAGAGPATTAGSR